MRGGTVLNIVPDECIFDFEFRNLPGDDPLAMYAEFTQFITATIEPEMRAVDATCGFSITPLSAMPLGTFSTGQALRMLKSTVMIPSK